MVASITNILPGGGAKDLGPGNCPLGAVARPGSPERTSEVQNGSLPMALAASRRTGPRF